MFKTILIANRGEIALRVARTAKRMGIRTIAVYSEADQNTPHVRACDEAVAIGPAPASESYLCQDKIIDACRRTGAEAVHPGYGFLSENAAFADALDAAGLTFIGPTADTIRAMGSKSAAKDLMESAGVPTIPGYQGEDQSLETFKREADRIGYPVLLKATAGGGGKGMRMVAQPSELEEALISAQREAKSAFGDDRFLIEKYVTRARHLEVQIFGDGTGHIVHMFERDCSVQRRHQKIIEEAPAPNLPETTRAQLLKAGVDAGKAVNYRGAGTVEFLYDADNDAIYFMEMNTRLQVEHPVSEMITGLDFVEWQIRIAAGQGLPLTQDDIRESGHAFEARLYAEDPYQNFAPSVGQLTTLHLPDQIARIDAGAEENQDITSFYDPMIAKIITGGSTREEALGSLRTALKATRVAGLETNASFLHALANQPAFIKGDVSTQFTDDHRADLFAISLAGPKQWAAAALWLRQQTEQPTSNPWDTLSGFRLNHPCQEIYWIEHEGKPAILQLSKRGEVFTASIEPDASAAARREGRHPQAPVMFEFRGNSDGALMHLEIADEAYKAYAAPHTDMIRIWIGADHWDIALPDPLQGSSAHPSSEGSLTAPMPGVVSVLSSQIGTMVEAGEPLLVMEAMKMEHIIKAPFNGVIKTYPFEPGDQVKKGDLLITFEETS